MTRLAWANIGERTFETGVDRGVLYIRDLPGIAWSGLTSVKESSSGGDTKANYIDGVKYGDRRKREEFEATIEAYTYPDEFNACNGVIMLGNGLYATQQRRKPFGFSYRTLVGNDVEGVEHAYKIHLVYNARTQPAGQDHSTMGGSIEPFMFSWKITTKAPLFDFQPTAHFVIDSRDTPAELMARIEDLLYGTHDIAPKLPTVGELLFMFKTYEKLVFDAGDVNDVPYVWYDSGGPLTIHDEIFDGGTP